MSSSYYPERKSDMGRKVAVWEKDRTEMDKTDGMNENRIEQD